MKLADFGKLSSKQDSEMKPLSDEDYLFMRAKMIEKLGSLATKYLPPAAPPVASKKAEKGKGGNKKQSKNTAAKIVKENTEKLLISDVNSMRIGNDVSLSENHKWHEPCSLLMSLLYWGLHVIHALKGKLKIDNKTAVIPMKVAMDCFVSLYRGKEDMKSICPVTLLDDIKVVDELLHKQLTKKYGDDLLALLSVDVPWLINENFYDTVKPKSIQLYEEQQLVLNMIDESLSTNKPVLVGYQVPPSGGKTILSVSIASMLAHKYRSKKLLYICYNTLVRKAVANACAQAAVPFWVASSRQKVAGDDPVSAIRPSNSCLSLTRRAKRERYLYALNTGFKNKESAMDEMYARAESQTVHHCPIIIADLASAIILLDLYPEDFVVYVDGECPCIQLFL